MGNFYESLIEYSGVSEYIPKNMKSFKESTIENIIRLPEDRVSFGEILKVAVIPNIKTHRIISTPKAINIEGQQLTGKKCIIEGSLSIRLEYIYNNENNKIYCYYFKNNFSAGVMLHKEILGSIAFIPSIFIEDINCNILSEREVLVLVTVMSAVEI